MSPDLADSSLGAMAQWPVQAALVLWDSFLPHDRSSVLKQAREHCCHVWILRSDKPSPRASEDNALLQWLGACLMLLLPASSYSCTTYPAGVKPSGTRCPRVTLLNFGCFVHPQHATNPVRALMQYKTCLVSGIAGAMTFITAQALSKRDSFCCSTDNISKMQYSLLGMVSIVDHMAVSIVARRGWEQEV